MMKHMCCGVQCVVYTGELEWYADSNLDSLHAVYSRAVSKNVRLNICSDSFTVGFKSQIQGPLKDASWEHTW